ncbi:B-cell receptor CD22-like [Pholidichthys leucotaenia]
MAVALTLFFIGCLLQGALCEPWVLSVPEKVEGFSGTCVTVTCSFTIDSQHDEELDHNCQAFWSKTAVITETNARKNTQTTNLRAKDCTTTFNDMTTADSGKYYFRLQCGNSLKYNFGTGVDIQVKAKPPSPTLTPSPLKVKEGSSVSLTCSALASCLSHPPTLTWTPNLGQSVETLQKKQDKTKVQTSVLTFTASYLHHGQKISCSAVYSKQDGHHDVSAESSLTADVEYAPKEINASVSPSGPVPENTNVTLTCSSNANPAVKIYSWYRANGDQETLIGTGPVLDIEASELFLPFFCKAEKEVEVGRSSDVKIDVQYPPKNTTILVSPSGPVPENRNVTLTCSSNANPAVKNYSWYRADGDQKTVISMRQILNFKASKFIQQYFCHVENEFGGGRSNLSQIDVHFPPQILLLSGCYRTESQTKCSCETVGKPSPSLLWYLDGLPVNQSDKFEISNVTLNDTAWTSFITVNQPQERDLCTLVCHSFNNLGSATQRFCVNSLAAKSQAMSQPFIITLVVLLLVIAGFLFVIWVLKTHHIPKNHLTDESNTVAVSELLTREENEAPNKTEECTYANAEQLKETNTATASETNCISVPNSGPNTKEKKGEEAKVVYASVNWKTKSKKKKEDFDRDFLSRS